MSACAQMEKRVRHLIKTARKAPYVWIRRSRPAVFGSVSSLTCARACVTHSSNLRAIRVVIPLREGALGRGLWPIAQATGRAAAQLSNSSLTVRQDRPPERVGS